MIVSWRKMFVLLICPADVTYNNEDRWDTVIEGLDFITRPREMFKQYFARNKDIDRRDFYTPIDRDFDFDFHYNIDGNSIHFVSLNPRKGGGGSINTSNNQRSSDSNFSHRPSWRTFLEDEFMLKECVRFAYDVAARSGVMIVFRESDQKSYENRIYQFNTKVKSISVHNECHEYRILDNHQEVHNWFAKEDMKFDCRMLNFLNTIRRAARLRDISDSFCPAVDPSVKRADHYIEFIREIMYTFPSGFESNVNQIKRGRRIPHMTVNVKENLARTYLWALPWRPNQIIHSS